MDNPPTASEIMAMPEDERNKAIQRSFDLAANQEFEIFEAMDDIIEADDVKAIQHARATAMDKLTLEEVMKEFGIESCPLTDDEIRRGLELEDDARKWLGLE